MAEWLPSLMCPVYSGPHEERGHTGPQPVAWKGGGPPKPLVSLAAWATRSPTVHRHLCPSPITHCAWPHPGPIPHLTPKAPLVNWTPEMEPLGALPTSPFLSFLRGGLAATGPKSPGLGKRPFTSCKLLLAQLHLLGLTPHQAGKGLLGLRRPQSKPRSPCTAGVTSPP